MENELKLASGAMIAIGLAIATFVVIPYLQIAEVKPSAALKPYSSAESRGRARYISEGCLYCHSQQPRSRNQAPDAERGWGRASVAADYYYDRPHLLGTARTGPDLLNIGARQPSMAWHLGHLYQPRAYVPGSIMPAYRYLFEVKDKAEAGEQVVSLPSGAGPSLGAVVAKPEAIDLVRYLLALDRTYSIDVPVKTKAAPLSILPKR